MPEKHPNSIKLGVKSRPMGFETKSAVSVAEMAQMVGLSRARFYQLLGTAFPPPVYSVSNHRPFFDEELQKTCLEVRRTGRGTNGQPVLFNIRRSPSRATGRYKRASTHQSDQHEELVASLRSLGLVATPGQIDAAIQTLFPNGTTSVEPGEVVRLVFIQLKSKGT